MQENVCELFHHTCGSFLYKLLGIFYLACPTVYIYIYVCMYVCTALIYIKKTM